MLHAIFERSPKTTIMEILHFIYIFEVSETFPTKPRKIYQFIEVAEYFDLAGLKLSCEERLIGKLSVLLVVELLIIADRYRLMLLRDMALILASKNLAIVHKSSCFEDLSSDLWNEILKTSDKRGRVAKVPVFDP